MQLLLGIPRSSLDLAYLRTCMTHVPSHLVPRELWIISGPRFPLDLYDNGSISSCSTGTLDHLWNVISFG